MKRFNDCEKPDQGNPINESEILKRLAEFLSTLEGYADGGENIENKFFKLQLKKKFEVETFTGSDGSLILILKRPMTQV